MAQNDNAYSLLFPIKLGGLKMLVWISENTRTDGEESLSSPHSHHVFELRYVESGNCSMMINGHPFTFQENSLILVRPGEYHYQTAPKTDPLGTQYSIRFSAEEPKTAEQSAASKAYSTLIEILEGTRAISVRDKYFGTLLLKLGSEMKQKPAGYIHTIQLLSTLILTDFLRSVNKNIDVIFPDEDIQYRGFLITKMEQFFSRKHMQDVKIQDLANDIKVSKRQAARILHQTYNMSFSQKLTEVRLQRAAYDLINSSLNMEEISRKCGFNNSSYFYMSFKKLYSLTPTEYRKLNQKNDMTI